MVAVGRPSGRPLPLLVQRSPASREGRRRLLKLEHVSLRSTSVLQRTMAHDLPSQDPRFGRHLERQRLASTRSSNECIGLYGSMWQPLSERKTMSLIRVPCKHHVMLITCTPYESSTTCRKICRFFNVATRPYTDTFHDNMLVVQSSAHRTHGTPNFTQALCKLALRCSSACRVPTCKSFLNES